MGSYETDENSSYREFDYYYQTIVVAFDIEYVVLITCIIGCRKVFSDF